jgi:hypothetical protein
MAEISLSPSTNDGCIIINVPAEYADRFRREARYALNEAFQKFDEAARRPSPEVDLDDLAAGSLVAENILQDCHEQEGDLSIEADAKALEDDAWGCRLTTADDLKGEAEADEPDIERVLDEFTFWHRLHERLAGEKVA